MTLVQAVEFRELIKQLTAKETQSFINELASCHPELIVSSLSSYFVYQSTNKGDHRENAQCNKIVSTIIQSRDSDNNAVDDERFDTLPRRIIGLCASYLDQSSYVALSATNRSTYLGCNTPCTLQEVNLRYRSKSTDSCPDLSTFPFATKMTPWATTDDTSESILASQIIRMPRLHSLDFGGMAWESIRIIAADNATNERITSASFCYTHNDSEPDKIRHFIHLLALFKNIQFLKVRMMGQPDQDMEWYSVTQPFIQSLSNLKGLDFDDNDTTGIECRLLECIGHQLQYLVLHDRTGVFSAVGRVLQVDFTNLRQLRQRRGCHDYSIRLILNTAVNLEKVSVPIECDSMEDILAKCKKLKYLEIDAFGGARLIISLDVVLHSLVQSFFQMHKEFLKIRFNVAFPTKSDCDKCVAILDRIIRILSKNKGDQWMLIFHLKPYDLDQRYIHLGESEFIRELHQGLPSDISETTVLQEGDNTIVLIANPGYPICGWRESWLMNL